MRQSVRGRSWHLPIIHMAWTNSFTQDGKKKYIVNPYQMVANEGKYYLICNYDKYENLSNYRIDRMTDVEILGEKMKDKKSGKRHGAWIKSAASYGRTSLYVQ